MEVLNGNGHKIHSKNDQKATSNSEGIRLQRKEADDFDSKNLKGFLVLLY